MRVLILGNRGQIGSFLESFLISRGVEVLGIDLNNHSTQDLRFVHPEILDEQMSKSDFVFFLAYDVGGSTYLNQYQSNFDFIQNNSLIMTNCFGSLQRTGKPFIFASSQMSNMTFSNYGLLKALGERYTLALQGISVKFWNVYGYETDKNKFHVISDFIRMGIEDGVIKMRTTGEETRDFLFVSDCCEGLFKIMTRFNEIDKSHTYDLASGKWTSIKEIAQIISEKLKVPIEVGDKQDEIQNLVKNNPNVERLKFWLPMTSIEEGIELVIRNYHFESSS